MCKILELLPQEYKLLQWLGFLSVLFRVLLAPGEVPVIVDAKLILMEGMNV